MEQLKDSISQMTLEEKISLCSGLDMWRLKGIDRLGIPSIMMANGPHGLQKQIEGEDHVGISESYPATCFPPAVIQAATWNPDLIREMGEALGRECRVGKVSILLGPGINIKRSPLGGRNYDYYSEDPFLTGEMAKAYVDGVQSQGVGTSLKHFAVSSQEYRRMTINAVVDERTLHEIYLSGFETVVKETQPWTVMNAYHILNGEYCSENSHILTDILKEEWGHMGFVVSDWGSVNDRVSGLMAGVDIEMPGPSTENRAKLLAAVESGELEEQVLDAAVERILKVVFKAKETLAGEYTFDEQKHHQLARRVAEEGIVLLKNEQNILPLQADKKVALIGRIAKEPRFQGGGSSLTTPTMVDNLYDEMVKRVGEGNIFYAPGYPQNDKADVEESLISEALAVAAQADVVVVLVGTKEAEGGDHRDMKLPSSHDALIEAIAVKHKNVVVLLSNGAPVEMPWVGSVPAILEGYLGGQAAAGAQADILLGNTNPSGKLGESFPIKLEDNPSHPYFPGGPLTVEYRESIYVGYRYYDTVKHPVLFPFGHGLSYTSFTYSDLQLDQTDESVIVSLKVKNTGKQMGKETVQVYVHDVESSTFRPEKELKGFAKVKLLPGEEALLTIELNQRAFAFYDVGLRDWGVEAGEFEILVGASSQDIRLTDKILLESDQKSSAQTNLEELAQYFNLSKSETISEKTFEALYGQPLPANERPQKGEYTLNTPIGDMGESFIGRMLYKMMLQTVRNMFTGSDSEEENPMLAMVENMIAEMPLRSMLMMSNGALKLKTLDALLMMINGKGFKGFFALVGSLVKSS